MAQVIMICGRLCCGKTTYAKRLAAEGNTVLLSIDEVMLSLFGQHCGDMHEEYAARTEKYLLEKSLEVISAGADVVLDWGFWRKDRRRRVKEFYAERGIGTKLVYMTVDEEEWLRRIEKRNAEVSEGRVQAYYVDENLARKFEGLFEAPEDSEINIYYPEN